MDDLEFIYSLLPNTISYLLVCCHTLPLHKNPTIMFYRVFARKGDEQLLDPCLQS